MNHASITTATSSTSTNFRVYQRSFSDTSELKVVTTNKSNSKELDFGLYSKSENRKDESVVLETSGITNNNFDVVSNNNNKLSEAGAAAADINYSERKVEKLRRCKSNLIAAEFKYELNKYSQQRSSSDHNNNNKCAQSTTEEEEEEVVKTAENIKSFLESTRKLRHTSSFRHQQTNIYQESDTILEAAIQDLQINCTTSSWKANEDGQLNQNSMHFANNSNNDSYNDEIAPNNSSIPATSDYSSSSSILDCISPLVLSPNIYNNNLSSNNNRPSSSKLDYTTVMEIEDEFEKKPFPRVVAVHRKIKLSSSEDGKDENIPNPFTFNQEEISGKPEVNYSSSTGQQQQGTPPMEPERQHDMNSNWNDVKELEDEVQESIKYLERLSRQNSPVQDSQENVRQNDDSDLHENNSSQSFLCHNPMDTQTPLPPHELPHVQADINKTIVSTTNMIPHHTSIDDSITCSNSNMIVNAEFATTTSKEASSNISTHNDDDDVKEEKERKLQEQQLCQSKESFHSNNFSYHEQRKNSKNSRLEPSDSADVNVELEPLLLTKSIEILPKCDSDSNYRNNNNNNLTDQSENIHKKDVEMDISYGNQEPMQHLASEQNNSSGKPTVSEHELATSFKNARIISWEQLDDLKWPSCSECFTEWT